MNIFEILKNEKFFNPLVGTNKRIYFECVTELIEYSKTTPILYESNIRTALDLFLSNKQYRVENDDTVFNSEDHDSAKIIRKFRECGWLTSPELGRNGEYITNITSSCRRVIDFLNRINNKTNDASISNRILSMYEILQSTYSETSVRKDRPYSSVIVPLMEDVAELKIEVLDLKDSISIIMNQITEINDLTGMGNYLLTDQLLEKFFNDYFFMKNNGLIPSILKNIADQLKHFRSDSLFDKAVKEYSERMQTDIEDTKDLLMKYIDEMHEYISVEYPENMELIDEMINKYYRLTNMRIHLITANGYNVQSAIDSILTKIKDADDTSKDIIINKLEDCIDLESQKYVSRKSYLRKKRSEPDAASTEINTDDLSDEEKARITDELMKNAINPYSIDRTNDYFDLMLKNNSLPFVKSSYIKNKEDALMFASAVIHASEDDFNFIVEMNEGYVQTEIADISNMIIRRKN